MSSWSCPHDLNGICQLVQGAACDPGMRGCVLHGKVRFASEAKNQPRKPVKAAPAAPPRSRSVACRFKAPQLK
jgi:hypothetical protein